MLPRSLPGLLIAATLATGCIEPELTRSTDLANLEVASLDMYFGSYLMWGQLHPVRDPRDPCAVLGTDFHARVNTLDLSAYPGDREDVCTSPTTSQPCEEQPAYCDPPSVELAWPPPLERAKLVVADRSREITCNLGDAVAARTMTRVDGGGWDVERGERITARVSPASDLSRFTVEIYFADPNRPIVAVPFTVADDTVTFTLPDLSAGTRTLYVHFSGDEAVDCDVPARAWHEYTIEQPLTYR